jgi:hypothetical protein
MKNFTLIIFKKINLLNDGLINKMVFIALGKILTCMRIVKIKNPNLVIISLKI